MASPRLMLITGEPSGDRIAAPVLRVLSEQVAGVSMYGIGGPACAQAGMECLYDVREMSVVGFVEVLRRGRFFRRVLHEMTSLLDTRRPDVLLLVDYPGFNIRLAREAHRRGIPVVYYVSPQVWAWHKSRITDLKRVVDEMLVIFPFEEAVYHEAGMAQARFVGHPLVEALDGERRDFSERAAFATAHGLDAERCWLLVFSGSRTEEVRRLLPVMSEAAAAFASRHGMQAILVESGSIAEDHYTEYLRAPLVRFRSVDATHELMHHAELGILKSGTTTLEAGLLGLPGVICYRTHPLTFAIGKRVVKLPYIGLINIALGTQLFPELLQSAVTVDGIQSELEVVMREDRTFRERLAGLEAQLRGGDAHGYPSEHVAEVIREKFGSHD